MSADSPPPPQGPDIEQRCELDTVRALLSASYRFSETTTTDEAADVLAEVACSLTGAHRAHVFVPDEIGSAVLTNANAARTDVGRGVLRIEPKEWVLRLRRRLVDQAVFVADATVSAEVHPGLRARFGSMSGLYLPLGDFGVLALIWEHRLEQAPDVDGLDAFAAHAAQVLYRRMEAAVLRGQSVTDPLTGLENRRSLCAALSRLPTGGSIILIDLDHFKNLNDAYGHRQGDLVLQRFARTLQDACPEGGCAARYGGEEFALVLPAAGEAEARHLAGRVRDCWAGTELTFSAGIAIQRHGATAEETMEAADRALYAAKRAGRDTVVLAPEVAWEEPQAALPTTPVASRTARPDDRLTLALLDEALEEGLVEPHYQAVVSTTGRGGVATEVLARLWHPRTLQLLEPAHFLPLAERTGRVNRLDAIVADSALAACAQWRRDVPDRTLSQGINVSVAHLDDPTLVSRLLDGCARHGLAPEALTVEVTETMQSFRGRGHEDVLRQLADAGVRIALDDFGTGFAALAYLLRFPVTGIKIDRSFTAAAVASSHGRLVLTSIVEFGLRLGLDVVAEGVETVQQLELLTELGCPLVQGYLFGRPVPACEVPGVLAGLSGLVSPAAPDVGISRVGPARSPGHWPS